MKSSKIEFRSRYETSDILAECDEFVLLKYGDGTVLARPQGPVFEAFWKAVFETNQSGEEKGEDSARMLRVMALGELLFAHRRIVKGEEEDCLPEVAMLLAKAFGPIIEEALSRGDETGTQDLQRKLAQAALQLVRVLGFRNDSPKTRTKSAWRIRWAIRIAGEYFKENLQRPSKEYIRGEIEKQDGGFKGRNHRKEWGRFWEATGLHNLPE